MHDSCIFCVSCHSQLSIQDDHVCMLCFCIASLCKNMPKAHSCHFLMIRIKHTYTWPLQLTKLELNEWFLAARTSLLCNFLWCSLGSFALNVDDLRCLYSWCRRSAHKKDSESASRWRLWSDLPKLLLLWWNKLPKFQEETFTLVSPYLANITTKPR